MPSLLDRILAGSCHDPFAFLGAHFDTPATGKVTLRTLQPNATRVELLLQEQCFEMQEVDSRGLFQLSLDSRTLPDSTLAPFHYRYRLHFRQGSPWEINDPYRFLPQLGEQDRYLFNRGTNYRLYHHLGAHLRTIDHVQGTIFRLWAPNAKGVSVVGDFNGWRTGNHPMRSLGDCGIWELFIPQVSLGERYKFSVYGHDGILRDKADPFQFFGEFRPQTASLVANITDFCWQDQLWQERKRTTSPYDRPMSIYEVHLGSWMRDPREPDRFLSYRELTTTLLDYVEDLGFTHIELLPIMEHPLDESWGYQVTGSFSVTSRYGAPADFAAFVNACHLRGIGVILDWVPAHFPRDIHSLGNFDGTALYEHQDERRGSHPEWGTLIYNYGRSEVSNYLIANALFWLDVFHIDGLRVDAVASMLYLDYARKPGEWLPNCYGGKENLEAIEFLKHLNTIVYQEHPNTLMIAEESTSFYGVSKAADQGGLGFGFKWNMGWMNDQLAYFKKDPVHRKYHHNSLTFSLMYAFSENFILPLSHDEVVHGKASLLEKMPGDLWQKFANLRLLFLSMWSHPGKKLLFMGSEFGQFSEWYCKRSLDWHLLEQGGEHARLRIFLRDLNKIYRQQPALWQQDFSPEGFRWLDLEDRDNSVITYARLAANKHDHLVCVFNHTPLTHQNYLIGLPERTRYKVMINSDLQQYGGSGQSVSDCIEPFDQPFARAPYSARVTLPPLAGIILQPDP